MNEYLEALQLALTQPRKRKPGTISSYTSTGRIFLEWLGDRIPPSDKDVRRYFMHREQQGIRAATRATEFTQLKKLFASNNWPWPFSKEDKPVVDDEPFAPAFTYDEVLWLIAARESYNPRESFYLAVATIYGPRREELARITKRDIRDSTITIKIAKKRKTEDRQHLIPEEIAPIITGWRPRERTARSLSRNFHRIMKKSGLGDRPGWGFHSIRRTLLTLLITNLAKNDLPISMAAEYLAWSKRSIGAIFLGSQMAGVYSHPEAVSGDPFQLDRTIQSDAIHPFLTAWRQ